MLHCSRRKQHRRLADCIHSTAGSVVPLSDDVSLGEVSSSDISNIIRLNKRLKDLQLPYYAVCGRNGNPSFRRVGDSCVDEKNIAYLSPADLSKRLQKHYGFSLDTLKHEDMATLRKKLEEKQEEQKAKKTKTERNSDEEKARPERLRRKRPAKTPDGCTDCESAEKERKEKKTDAEKEKEERLNRNMETLEQLMASSRKQAA